MTVPRPPSIAAARAAYRANLVAAGFVDDGETLRGEVRWTSPQSGPAVAIVDIKVSDAFPFGPPHVFIHQAGAPLELTFHIERNGRLCLWESSYSLDDPDWMDADRLRTRICGWLEATAAGWPGDTDVDLERYMPDIEVEWMVLYDSALLAGIAGVVGTVRDDDHKTITVTPERAKRVLRARGKQSWRPDRQLAVVADLGEVSQPCKSWEDVRPLLGIDERLADTMANEKNLDVLLLRYSRNGNPGVLALKLVRHGQDTVLRACTAADMSAATRQLRRGFDAPSFADSSVAVVGCGAVGSYVADALFRCGVGSLTLLDWQRLTPGNVIRHACGKHLVGHYKPNAVRVHLELTGLDVTHVNARIESVNSPEDALELVRAHDVVVDATADERATALLRWAAQTSGRRVVSVALQRVGGIARADRFPLRQTEHHLPALPPAPGQPADVREHGCGDAVSQTPPSSPFAAAELAVAMVLDLLRLDEAYPASVVRVLRPQPDAPYDSLVTLTSAGPT